MSKSLNNKTILFFIVSLFTTLFFVRCTESTVSGLDLVDNSRIDLEVAVLNPIASQTVFDSVLIYSPSDGNITNTFSVGEFVDNRLGLQRVDLAMLPVLSSAGLDLSLVTLDSAQLNLVFGSANFIGDLSEPINVKVSTLQDQLNLSDSYYICQSCSVHNPDVLLVDTMITVNTEDSSVDNELIEASLRLNLDTSFFSSFIMNSNNLATDDAFASAFKGLLVEVENSDALINFNMNDVGTEMTLFYTDENGLNQTFSFLLGEIAPKAYNTNNSAPVLSTNELFLRGLSNDAVILDLDVVTPNQFDGVSINRAELVIPVSFLADTSLIDVPDILLSFSLSEEGILEQIEDTRLGTGFASFYGGALVEDEFRLNITTFFNAMINEEGNTEITIAPLNRLSNANRIVFENEDGSNPITLEVTFAEIIN